MLLLSLLAAIAFQPAGSAEQVDFLRMSFKANKDAFAFGTFRFEYTRGRCANPADAESEVFSKSIKEDGLYVFDGKNERYDLLADPAALAAVTMRIDKSKSSSFAMVFRSLTNGEVTLRDQRWLDDSNEFSQFSPEIYPGKRLFCDSAYFQFPLSLGNCDQFNPDLFDELSLVKDGKCTITELDFDSRLDGLPVCKLSYAYKIGKCTHWIDRNRGCLSIRVLIHDDQSGSDSIYRFSDFEQVAGAGWLARRRLHTWANGNLADRIVVTEIDTMNRPSRSLFQLDFPKPVPLPDRVKRVIYPARKTWSLLDLPDVSSPGTQTVAQQVFAGGEMPGEIEAGLNWLIPVAGIIGLVAVAALLVFLRWRRNASQVV
jgi:hypothetical protein